ncbi:MAG: PilZ domain-containing protein [Chitinispirillales bacterium]|nr:PilZ domain-containing protein [Chitinispirillales bacterium]
MSLNHAIKKSSLLCLLLALPALSEHAVMQMQWPKASPAIIMGLILFFGTAFGVLVSVYFGSRRKNIKNAVEASNKLFNEGCERCKLTVEEGKMLRDLAAYAPEASTKSHTIFDTLALFEHCVDAHVNSNIFRSLSAGGQTEGVDALLGGVRRKLGYGSIAPEQPLISTRNLSTGQRVTVSAGGQQDITAGQNGTVSYVGEFYFTVRMSGRAGGGGSVMAISLLRQSDAAYIIPAHVKEAAGGEVSFFHTLSFTRNQSRNYMRFDIVLPVKFKLLERIGLDPEEVKKEAAVFQTRTFDIGGGGLSFIMAKPLLAGDVLLMSLQLPGRSLGGIKARVLKIIPIEGKALTQYKHLLQFNVIEPQQREYIVRFIFDKQREALQLR